MHNTDNGHQLLTTDHAIKFSKDFFAGATAAAIAKTAIAPVERVKLILQLQTSQSTISVESRYKGMIDCFIRVPREQGFLSFWRGNVSNVFRAASQESLGMAFKELFKVWCLNDVDKDKNYRRFLMGFFFVVVDRYNILNSYFFGNLLAGGLAGSATFFIIYPLDFSRTRLAVDMGKDVASREFRGLLDCLYKIAKHDGFLGLYRGFLPSLQYIFLYRSAYYGIFDSIKVFFSKSGKGDDVNFAAALLVGQISALVAAMISYPLDTVRRRLMMQSGKKVREYDNALSCTKSIYRSEGFRAFYSGFFVNAIRGIGAALVLAIYNDISKHI